MIDFHLGPPLFFRNAVPALGHRFTEVESPPLCCPLPKGEKAWTVAAR
ncbi:hypothetical protein AB0K92_03290 [Streptomyces sp. NPDC052687]